MDARRRNEPLTAKRKAIFLTELAKHGVLARAARVASPNSMTGACATFREEAKRDPEFATQITEAREQADGDLLVELHRRAVEGTSEPIFGPNGQQVGSKRRYSDRLLLEKIKSRFPADFAARTVSEVTQQTTLRARVEPMNLDRLCPESWADLRRILERELEQPSAVRPREEDAQ
jgi:hypothetical protein